MLRTISIGTRIMIQGVFVRALETGLMQVRVGDRLYTGRPV